MSKKNIDRPDGIETRKRILDFIAQFIEKNGYSPSYRQIGKHLGLAYSNVFYHVQKMRERNLISCTDGISRTIRINSAPNFPPIYHFADDQVINIINSWTCPKCHTTSLVKTCPVCGMDIDYAEMINEAQNNH